MQGSGRGAPRPGQVKLLSLDLDGTLLRSDRTIGPRTCKALNAANAAGVHVVLNSGRMTVSMEFAADLLDFDVYLVSYNGAVVAAPRSAGRKKLFERPMPAEVARELALFAKARGLQLNYYLDDLIYSEDGPRLRPHIDLYIRRTGSPYRIVERIEGYLDRAPYKVLFIVEPGLRDALEVELTPRYGTRSTITRTDPEYLEFLHPQVDKGVGMKGLCGVLGISMDAVMAIGDADNDLPMLSAAGWGVGVANARPRVRAAADALTSSGCDEDAVAEALERWVLF